MLSITQILLLNNPGPHLQSNLGRMNPRMAAALPGGREVCRRRVEGLVREAVPDTAGELGNLVAPRPQLKAAEEE